MTSLNKYETLKVRLKNLRAAAMTTWIKLHIHHRNLWLTESELDNLRCWKQRMMFVARIPLVVLAVPAIVIGALLPIDWSRDEFE